MNTTYCWNEDMDAIDAALERHMERISKLWESTTPIDWGEVIFKLEKSKLIKENANSNMHKLPNYIYGHLLS